MLRNLLMILFVTCSTVGGQLFLKQAMTRLAARQPPLSGLDWLLAAFVSPGVWAAIAIQGVGFIVWMVVISRLKLGVAFAIAGAFLYMVMALVGWLAFGERLAPLQWLGIAMISAGVLMISTMGQQA